MTCSFLSNDGQVVLDYSLTPAVDISKDLGAVDRSNINIDAVKPADARLTDRQVY
jgi:hypothetical protein